mmetsp:Transcript_21835/g.54110  ORF Transcript_21835/g.54110 Transcript_21835/m.54110 type:complete len:200 (+) Transcript_21835:711-1310(+)
MAKHTCRRLWLLSFSTIFFIFFFCPSSRILVRSSSSNKTFLRLAGMRSSERSPRIRMSTWTRSLELFTVLAANSIASKILLISWGERFQFSVEKAYSVMQSTLSCGCVFRSRRRDRMRSTRRRAPSRCPTALGRLRWVAQRPFPSQINPTCRGTCFRDGSLLLWLCFGSWFVLGRGALFIPEFGTPEEVIPPFALSVVE